jgi:hypothetical protein
MADPVIPGGIRVQFVLPGRSGLPEDRYITTWAFRTLDNLPPTEAQLSTAAGLVSDFFTAVSAGQVSPVASLLGIQVDKPNCEARCYRLGDAPPREPFVFPKNLGAVGTSGLPSEVAICASFYATRNMPRRRGRVYIGPLSSNGNVINDQGDVPRPRPASIAVNAISLSSKRLQAAAAAAQLPWGIVSQTDLVMRDVTNGWVDDAFDTQRRRGEESQSRISWAS